MFYKTMTAPGAEPGDQPVTTKSLDYTAVGLAILLLFAILVAAFIAHIIGFTDGVTPLITTFTTGAAGVFGATVGESISAPKPAPATPTPPPV